MVKVFVFAAVFFLPTAVRAVEQCKYACTCVAECTDICRDGPVFTYCASFRCAQDPICQGLKDPKEQDNERAAAPASDSLLVCASQQKAAAEASTPTRL